MAVHLLTPLLALVGSVGMSPADREEWLAAACMALHDVPEDLLRRGIDAARKTVDHPAKIVPAIRREIETPMRWRTNRMNDAQERLPAPKVDPAPQPEQFDPWSAEEIRAMSPSMIRMGLSKGWLNQAEVDAALAEPAPQENIDPAQADRVNAVNPATVNDRQDLLRTGDDVEHAAIPAAGKDSEQ